MRCCALWRSTIFLMASLGALIPRRNCPISGEKQSIAQLHIDNEVSQEMEGLLISWYAAFKFINGINVLQESDNVSWYLVGSLTFYWRILLVMRFKRVIMSMTFGKSSLTLLIGIGDVKYSAYTIIVIYYWKVTLCSFLQWQALCIRIRYSGKAAVRWSELLYRHETNKYKN